MNEENQPDKVEAFLNSEVTVNGVTKTVLDCTAHDLKVIAYQKRQEHARLQAQIAQIKLYIRGHLPRLRRATHTGAVHRGHLGPLNVLRMLPLCRAVS